MGLSFTNASNDHLSVADSASLDITEGTLCFWGTGMDSMTNGDSVIQKTLAYQLVFSNAQQPKMIIFNSDYQELEVGYNDRIQDSGVHHIVCIWDNTTADKIYIYIDAVLKIEAAKNSGAITATANEMKVGEWDNDLEDVRVYNRALSLDEIKTIYHSRGCDKIVSGLVYRGVYLGPEGAAASGTIPDWSPSGNTSTVNDSPDYVAFGLRLF